jgi:hypothetical protein
VPSSRSECPHHDPASQDHCLITLILSQDQGAQHLSAQHLSAITLSAMTLSVITLSAMALSAMTLSTITPITPLCHQSNQGIELEHLYKGIEVELLSRDEEDASVKR